MNALQFLQAASNAAASNVSGPVDLIGAALRKIGVPVPQNALMSSEWMAERGLTKPVPQNALSIAGETFGLAAPIAAAAKAPQIARGLMDVADDFQRYNQALGPAGASQAVVWHGSPHKFDRFDSSKIGTGEGAQAYGHGLYLAESDRVAKQYADTLTDKAPRFLDGVPADQLSTAQRSALGMLADAGGNPNAALLAAKTDMARSGGAGAEFHVERYNTLRDIARGKLQAQVGEPSLYKVDLPDEAIARMLDWDKPLSQQAPWVREALSEFPGHMRGQDAYSAMSYGVAPSGFDDAGRALFDGMAALRGRNPAGAVESLRKRAIPGIRYLDGGSRGAGSGTSNYVVFPGEENMLKILERNGQPMR